MTRLFGTDGIRGKANKDLTPELALNMGMAVAKYVSTHHEGEEMPLALVGKDSRISGDFLANALIAGMTSMGINVIDLGLVPTPAVAYLTNNSKACLGVMISASHNVFSDNGIKFFDSHGRKFPDHTEDEIQAIFDEGFGNIERPLGADLGKVYAESLADSYVDHLASSCNQTLEGLHIVVDCANGASSEVAEKVFAKLNAKVTCINNAPNGCNINDKCGSTHPEDLQAKVVELKADFGVAYDGDADRCLAVDHEGNLVDGDKIMGILALSFKDKGMLEKDTLVVTVMSNLGLILSMREAGIETIQTSVGDRYVLEGMTSGGYNLGGEQSGHVIASDYVSTGDGILTSLLLAKEVKESGKSLSDLATRIKRLPQTLVNVPNVDKSRVGEEKVQQAIAKANEILGDTGRVLLRASGTEPLVRVMVEAQTQEQADSVCKDLAKIVAENLAL